MGEVGANASKFEAHTNASRMVCCLEKEFKEWSIAFSNMTSFILGIFFMTIDMFSLG